MPQICASFASNSCLIQLCSAFSIRPPLKPAIKVHCLGSQATAKLSKADLELIRDHVPETLIIYRTNEDVSSEGFSSVPTDHRLPCKKNAPSNEISLNKSMQEQPLKIAPTTAGLHILPIERRGEQRRVHFGQKL